MDKNFKDMMENNIYYDASLDTLWIMFQKGTEASYREFSPGVRVELDQQKQVIGVEIESYQQKSKIKSDNPTAGLSQNKTLQRLLAAETPSFSSVEKFLASVLS